MNVFFKYIFVLLHLFLITYSYAQSDYIPIQDKSMDAVNRLDIKLRNNPVYRFSTVKPLNRQAVTSEAERLYESIKAGTIPAGMTATDIYNLREILIDNRYLTENYKDSFVLKNHFLKPIYPTKAHAWESNSPDFTIIADPVTNYQLGKSNDGSKTIFINTRGIRINGQIDQKIGFYTFMADNQERDPLYVREWVSQRASVPGQGYWKGFDGHDQAYDYFDVRGGLTFKASSKVDFALAYDKFFIGDGYRTFFISDFSAPMLFLRSEIKINDRLRYNGVIAQTVASFNQNVLWPIADTTRPRNYMMFHHLAWQTNEWLQLGFYAHTMWNTNGIIVGTLPDALYTEGVTADVKNKLRSSLGFDFKANAWKNIQLYGQLLIHDFTNGGLLEFGTSAKNKKAYQLGIKYIDAFTLSNLNLQLEYNSARPYAFSDDWNVNNYAHYNQPLAHPLGANFNELVGIAHYQPWKRVYVTGKMFYSRQGLSSTSVNYGSDIFLPSQYQGETHIKTLDGILSKQWMASGQISYEFLQNIFIDGYYFLRDQSVAGQPKNKMHYFTLGLRWHWNRRDFEF